MNRLFLVAAVLLIGFEGFRAWWFSPGDEWNGTPRLLLDTRAVEESSAMRLLRIEHHVDTGALQFDRAAFLQTPAESTDPNEGKPLPPAASSLPLPSILFLEYDPGNDSIWHDLFMHPPEVCMRSSGCVLDAVLPARSVTIGTQEIPVRCFRYREPVTGHPLFLFKLVWLPENSPILPTTEKPEKRPLWIRMALTRRQTPPGSVLLARVRQVPDFDAAWAIVESQMLAHLELERTR